MKENTMKIRSTYDADESYLIRKRAKQEGRSLQSYQRIATLEKANAKRK